MTNINDFLTSMVEQAEQSRQGAQHPTAAGRELLSNKKKNGSGEKGEVPLTVMAIPSLLTRAKLSPLGRRLEERRLALIEKKRQQRKKGQKKSRGRNHWKRKEATRLRRNKKDYIRSAGLGAILTTRMAKRIDPALWDRYIGECFREYTPELLKVKAIKRAPGFGRNAYYGNKEFPMTVYSFRVVHQTLGVVWDGEHQRQLDGVEVLRIPQNQGQ